MTAIDLVALPPVMVVPGIARWLGRTTPDPDDSIDSIDSYEAYLIRISEQVA